MRRGEIYYANLDPALGSEQAKRRPVLMPAASTGLRQNSKALAQQIRTVSKQRIAGRRLGQVTGELMQAVERAIRIHLDLR